MPTSRPPRIVHGLEPRRVVLVSTVATWENPRTGLDESPEVVELSLVVTEELVVSADRGSIESRALAGAYLEVTMYDTDNDEVQFEVPMNDASAAMLRDGLDAYEAFKQAVAGTAAGQ